MNKSKRNIPLIFIALLTIAAAGCTRAKEPITRSGLYFDTIISVTLYDDSKSAELEHCFALADQYEAYFSASIADSDVSRINAAGGKPVTVHEETIELLEKGLYYSELSKGAFDITIGRLAGLWDFQAEHPTVPDADAIADAVATINYHNVELNGNEVTLKDPASAIDLGGIAKGYIADKMKEYLTAQDIDAGIINLGGNVLTIGTKKNGAPYNIAIQKPFSDNGEPIAAVKITDMTVVTSGTYERYFEEDGIRYHHILDVRTGYPYDNGLSSVSIICKNSVDGDGLSTTCFALGLTDGMALIESLPDTEAVFITTDNQLHYSSGIGKTITVQEM